MIYNDSNNKHKQEEEFFSVPNSYKREKKKRYLRKSMNT